MYSLWLPREASEWCPILFIVFIFSTANVLGSIFAANVPLAYAGLALIMAILWFFSTALYGIATQWLGDLGVVVGWAVFMSLIVITASILGILTGEWRHSGRAPVFCS